MSGCATRWARLRDGDGGDQLWLGRGAVPHTHGHGHAGRLPAASAKTGRQRPMRTKATLPQGWGERWLHASLWRLPSGRLPAESSLR